MPTVEERVASGAYMLDVHAPGWRDKIDLDRLNVRSCDDCILGQVFGEYTTGLIELGVWPTGEDVPRPPHMIHQSMLGFAIDADSADADLRDAYPMYCSGLENRAFDRLREAWIQVLA